MKDKHARGLAVTALVFMGIFVGSLIATLVDYTLLYGAIGYVALVAGVVALAIFFVLKADGRGFSLADMKNESELKKIEQALEDQQAEVEQRNDDGDAGVSSDGEEKTSAANVPTENDDKKSDDMPS